MEEAIIIIIYLLGLLAMIIEMFLPGAIIGVTGFLAASGAVVYAVVQGHTALAAVLIFASIAAVPCFFVLWRNVLARHFALRTDESTFRPSTTVTEDLEGKEGVAETPLHPSGIARFDGRRIDVVTRGEMLDKGTHVIIIDVAGNRVVVKSA